MTAEIVLGCCVALLLLAAAAALGARARLATPLVYGGTAATCLLAFVAALTAGDGALVAPIGLPWLGAHFRVDRLAALFLALVNLGGTAASVYGIGYGRHERAPQRVLPFFPAFIAGMNLVVIADDAYTFLFAWELMSLTSWALVMSNHASAESGRAGLVYLLMATASALTLLLAFGLLAGAGGSYAFADMRAGTLAPWQAAMVLSLALIGAGSKAGLMPLHVWLPLAHPAAPSHVSALMSAVMTKVAIYAFIRIVLDLLGPTTWWWAATVLTAGGTTAAIGVLHALMERDLKRLLAYSTIENVGIVFIGLGLAMGFRANGMTAAAALALTAALFHAFNHMLFKSALFFGAGSALAATGERNIERLGGLIHRMPVSAACMLAACMAAAALPPLNGFASEWLTFQTILVSPALPQWGLRLLVPTIGTMLALAAALAAACFVRAYGIAWLGRERSACVASAHETDRFSLAAMIALVALCLLAGMFPGLIIDALSPAVQQVVGGRLPLQSGLPWLSIIPVAGRSSSYNPLMVFVFFMGAALVVSFAVHQLGTRAVRRARLWDCGYPDLGPATQYTAASHSQPIRRVFGPLVFRSSEIVLMPPPGDLSPARIRKRTHDLAWELLYTPLVNAVLALAEVFNRFQFLTIRRYLGFVFASLVGLLLALAVWQ